MESNPTHVATVEGKVEGKYRGVPWKSKIPQIIPVNEPNVDLKYRGVPYRRGVVKVIDTATKVSQATVTHPEMLSTEQPEKEIKRSKVKS